MADDPAKYGVSDTNRRRVLAHQMGKGHAFNAQVGRKIRIGKTGYWLRLVETGDPKQFRVVIKPEEDS